MDHQEIMREYANQRAQCAGKSVDQLLALANGNEIEFIQSLEMAVQQKSERIGVDGLSEEEIVVLAVDALEREVNNGGYSQFFFNHSREFTPMIVPALLRIGCSETAEITKDAVRGAGFEGLEPMALAAALDAFGERSEDRDLPSTRTDNIEGKLDACDRRYYSSREDIAGSLIAFVKANKDKIQP